MRALLFLIILSLSSFAIANEPQKNFICIFDTQSDNTLKISSKLGVRYELIAYCRVKFAPVHNLWVNTWTFDGETRDIRTNCPSTLRPGQFCKIWANWTPDHVIGYRTPVFSGGYDEMQGGSVLALAETFTERE